MLTTAFVVALRPFQLLLSCLSLVLASLDQFYQDSTFWIWILLALILPSTLLTISVSVHTTFAYKHRHVLPSWTLTIRWILDLMALALTSAALAVLLLDHSKFTYRQTPPAPFITIVLIVVSVNIAFFLATTVMLAIEDYAFKTAHRLDRDLPPRLGHIEHVTHNEAILGPRPEVAPKEVAFVISRPCSPEDASPQGPTSNRNRKTSMSQPLVEPWMSNKEQIGGPKRDFWNV